MSFARCETGYQSDRARDALAKILETFIAKELQAYVQTFPVDYYRELFRLRGLPFPTDTVKRPQYFGILTNDIVYKRIAPGVLDELKRVTPRDEETGRHKQHLFRRLTSNTGYPKLREHLGSVVTIMKLSSDYSDFKAKLDLLHPKYGETIKLPFDYDDKADDEGNLALRPASSGGFLGYLFPFLGCHPGRPRLAAHTPQRHGGGVLAVLGGDVLNLTGGDLGDHDGVADSVGWPLFAFRASGHLTSLFLPP